MSIVEFHGTQVIADLWDCKNSAPLNNPQELASTLSSIATKHKATVCGNIVQQFVPCGVSVLIAIGESHISMHTWPESGDAMLDVCTCGCIDSEAIANDIIDWLQPEDVRVEKITRGLEKRRNRL